jgi:hypothetical protein
VGRCSGRRRRSWDIASHDWHMAARDCICTGDSSGIVRTNDLARTVSYWCHPIARAVDAFRTTPTDSAWGVPLSVGRCVRDILKHRTSIGTNILFVKLMVCIYICTHTHALFTYLQNWMNHQVVCPICDCTGLHDLLPQMIYMLDSQPGWSKPSEKISKITDIKQDCISVTPPYTPYT